MALVFSEPIVKGQMGKIQVATIEFGFDSTYTAPESFGDQLLDALGWTVNLTSITASYHATWFVIPISTTGSIWVGSRDSGAGIAGGTDITALRGIFHCYGY